MHKKSQEASRKMDIGEDEMVPGCINNNLKERHERQKCESLSIIDVKVGTKWVIQLNRVVLSKVF